MIRKNASTLMYLIFLFSVILAFCAMAIDATIIYNTRMKLQDATERAAMVGAEAFNTGNIILNQTQIEDNVNDNVEAAFSHFLFGPLNKNNAQIIDVQTKYSEKKVLVKSKVSSPTFFLGFLGIHSVNIKATACAVNEKMDVKSNLNSAMWLTSSAMYLSGIVNSTSMTYLQPPLGAGYLASFLSSVIIFPLIDNLDNEPLSLGPGGYFTVRLPAPMVDKRGPDLFIKEAGDALEGYFVFAGIDKIIENATLGEGGASKSAGDTEVDTGEDEIESNDIVWKEITCSAIPETVDMNGNPRLYSSNGHVKVYGSAYFDLGNSCVNLAVAKYIKIVDDNSESAFVKKTIGTSDTNYYKAMLYGEASTATAGADIDAIQILNFVKLIPPSEF